MPDRAFPDLTEADWAQPRQALTALRDWAVQRAVDAIEWYQRDELRKRTSSRLLRAVAIGLAVGGGVAPLLSGAVGTGWQGWGYVLLAAAAGCLAFDHFFGLATGWMRDRTTVHALRRRLGRFQFEWTAATRAQALGGAGKAVDDAARLELIRRFVEDVAEVIEAETGQWLTELQASVRDLHSSGVSWPGIKARRPASAAVGHPVGDEPAVTRGE